MVAAVAIVLDVAVVIEVQDQAKPPLLATALAFEVHPLDETNSGGQAT
jgi:hypothetical protein